MHLIQISPFIRFAKEAVVPKRNKESFCSDCRIIFITGGYGKLNINGKNYDFKPGTLCFWQSATLYRFSFKNTVKALVIDFDLISDGSNQKEIMPLIPKNSPNSNEIKLLSYNFSDVFALNSPIIIENAFFVENDINRIITEFRKQTLFSDANTSAYLKLCISKIASTAMMNEKDSEITKKLDYITDYIQKNLTTNLSNGMLANLVGYHPYYLNRIFKQTKGITLHQYILNCKLSLSADLLLSTNFTISEIAERSGFNNQISFLNAFKKLYRLTPSEFRSKTL